MRYLMIDRIREIELNKRIVALKNVAMSEDIFADHFVGFPVMPGAMVIEAMAQAATALLEISREFKIKAILAIVERAKFRTMVHPGDQLSITVELKSQSEKSAMMEGTVQANDAIVMDARLIFTCKPVEEVYHPLAKQSVSIMYDFWLKGAKVIGSGERNG